MQKHFLALITAALVAAGGLLSVKAAVTDNPVPPQVRGKILQRLVERLNLTAEQKTQIRSILAGEKDGLQPLLAHLRVARSNLRRAIQAGDANEDSVRAASAIVAGAEADLAVERMKLYGKIAPILTEEQRQKIAGMATPAENRAGDRPTTADSGSGD